MDVKLAAADGVELAGTYIPGALPVGAVLLHMMPASRQSFDGFAERLSREGLHVLAIDLRGHGESGGGDYRSFTDKEHAGYAQDALAAAEYLRKQYPDVKIGWVGASIGANLALRLAAAGPSAFAVALSPGLNYHGYDAAESVRSVPADLPVYFAASLDDPRVAGNAAQTETLYNLCASRQKSIRIFREGGHGTDLLSVNDFLPDLVDWIMEVVK